MIELELLGIGADGESLVFTDPSGERYTTPITDELRGALRRERPQLDVAPEPAASLKPSQIQTLLRAGLTAVEVASEHNLDLHLVQGFEAPIQAEKDYVVRRAQQVRVGGEPDGPFLVDLVVDRLATRAVAPSSLLWSARREVDSPWEVSVSFIQGAAEYAAHWHFIQSTMSLDAIDQEARWLTETSTNSAPQTIFPPIPTTRETTDPQDSAADSAQREALVDQLNAARGKRVDVDIDDADTPDEDEDDALTKILHGEAEPAPQSAAPSISARIYSLAHAKTKREEPGEAPAAEQTPPEQPSGDQPGGGQPVAEATAPADTLPGLDSVPGDGAKEKKRTKRRSVPSWDEIVFGSKP